MCDTIPATQKSLVLHKESTPYVIEETPVPRPGPRDVLVKIMACALNPADAAIVDPPFSTRLIQQWPHIPGCDAAGVVVDLGAEVTNRKKGDRILFQGGMVHAEATFQQYAIVPEDLNAIIPDNVTFEQAATIPLAFTTDFIGLFNHSPAPENLGLRLQHFWEAENATAYVGEPAFIVGGAASLGQYAIQLARLAGHDPIIATASPHNAALLKSLGATHVLDRSRSNESVLAELSSLTGGKPIKYAFAAVGPPPEALRLAGDALAPGGALATAMPTPLMVPADIANPGEGKRIGYMCGSSRLPFTREIGVTMYQLITRWLGDGLLKPNPVEVLPNGLAGINDGLARIKANKVSGTKLVARPQETP